MVYGKATKEDKTGGKKHPCIQGFITELALNSLCFQALVSLSRRCNENHLRTISL